MNRADEKRSLEKKRMKGIIVPPNERKLMNKTLDYRLLTEPQIPTELPLPQIASAA